MIGGGKYEGKIKAKKMKGMGLLSMEWRGRFLDNLTLEQSSE